MNDKKKPLRPVRIDGQLIEVNPDMSVLQACEQAGVEIPRFCYHPKLSVAGNCRMCLVEVKGTTKPVASCAYGVADLRPGPGGSAPEISTTSQMVEKARRGVMEFLLINHPLDCPICDQGGECDLQDQALGYGRAYSRYTEGKRAVKDVPMGPLIKTIMTRCIHCTRCVRFANEIAGTPVLGLVNRGEDAAITTYLEKAVDSELSGNLIDVCPVGALTSAPYAFSARPWELEQTATIDVMDALGAAMRIDTRGRDIKRIVPRRNDMLNEMWLTDKARFTWDGLKSRRLDKPFVKQDGRWRACGWDEALDKTAAALVRAGPDSLGAISGDLVGMEAVYALRLMFDAIGATRYDCCQEGAGIIRRTGDARRDYRLFLCTTSLPDLETADAVLLVGTNLRLDSPLTNARLRRAWMESPNMVIGRIGPAFAGGYECQELGAGPDSVEALARGQGDFAAILARAERPVFLIGVEALRRPDAEALLALLWQAGQRCGLVGEEWQGWNIVHRAAGRPGAVALDFLPAAGKASLFTQLEKDTDDGPAFLYNLGADEISVGPREGRFIVYQGHHGDKGAAAADVILPSACFTEQSATYMNMHAMMQETLPCFAPPGLARQDWAILRAVSERIGAALPFDDLESLRARMRNDESLQLAQGAFETAKTPFAKGRVAAKPFVFAGGSYYLTNPVARASSIMQSAHRAFSPKAQETGMHGTGTVTAS